MSLVLWNFYMIYLFNIRSRISLLFAYIIINLNISISVRLECSDLRLEAVSVEQHPSSIPEVFILLLSNQVFSQFQNTLTMYYIDFYFYLCYENPKSSFYDYFVVRWFEQYILEWSRLIQVYTSVRYIYICRETA